MQNIDPLTGVAVTGAAVNTSASMIGGYAGSTTGSRRAYSSMSGHVSGRYPGSRSWHPSPYASDNDETASEPQFYKEEKKNRIKMEIARRRQQIEENASLHDELTRLAKLRETAELSDRLNVNTYGTSPMSPAMAAAAAAAAGGSVVTSTGTSVLKSVDEILRSANDPLHTHHSTLGSHHGTVGTTDYYGALAGTGIMSSGGGIGGLTSGLTTTSAAYGSTGVDGQQHHRVTDFSPINSDMIDHRSHFRSSSADPTLSYGNSTAYTSAAMSSGNHIMGVAGGVGVDPYGGGKYSKYGTMTGTSSLYRKY